MYSGEIEGRTCSAVSCGVFSRARVQRKGWAEKPRVYSGEIEGRCVSHACTAVRLKRRACSAVSCGVFSRAHVQRRRWAEKPRVYSGEIEGRCEPGARVQRWRVFSWLWRWGWRDELARLFSDGEEAWRFSNVKTAPRGPSDPCEASRGIWRGGGGDGAKNSRGGRGEKPQVANDRDAGACGHAQVRCAKRLKRVATCCHNMGRIPRARRRTIGATMRGYMGHTECGVRENERIARAREWCGARNERVLPFVSGGLVERHLVRWCITVPWSSMG